MDFHRCVRCDHFIAREQINCIIFHQCLCQKCASDLVTSARYTYDIYYHYLYFNLKEHWKLNIAEEI